MRAEEVDAGCPVPWWQMEWNLVLLGPIGQEFVAGRDRMSFVDLWLAEGKSNSDGVELLVRIRETDIGGVVLASSRALTLPDGFNDFARFEFGHAVALTPGETYFVEVLRGEGSGYAMIRGGVDDICPGIRAWVEGQPREGWDLWFQVGWDPASVALETARWGVLKSSY